MGRGVGGDDGRYGVGGRHRGDSGRGGAGDLDGQASGDEDGGKGEGDGFFHVLIRDSDLVFLSLIL